MQELSWTPPKRPPIDISDALLESLSDDLMVTIAKHQLEFVKKGFQPLMRISPEEKQKLRESGSLVGSEEGSNRAYPVKTDTHYI